MTCSEPGCERPAYRRLTICRPHYEQHRRERIAAAQPFDALARAADYHNRITCAEARIQQALLVLEHPEIPGDVVALLRSALDELHGPAQRKD